MKTEKRILRIISLLLCAVILSGAVPAVSRAEVVERAANAAVVSQGANIEKTAVMKDAGDGDASRITASAVSSQQADLSAMRAGADESDKKPSYYWTAFYVIGAAVVIMVLMGSV